METPDFTLDTSLDTTDRTYEWVLDPTPPVAEEVWRREVTDVIRDQHERETKPYLTAPRRSRTDG